MRRAARADGNQALIVEALRKEGHVVWHIKWPVDLLVRPARGTRWLPMEVKDSSQAWRLTDDQVAFLNLAGDCPAAVVTDVDGALRAVAAVCGGDDDA